MFWLAVFSALTLSARAHLDYPYWECSSIPEVEQVEFCRADIGKSNVNILLMIWVDKEKRHYDEWKRL